MRKFAEILKEEREIMSLSQTDLGDKLNCSRYRVADLERGRIKPTIDNIRTLCNLFGVSADYLLGRTDVRTTDLDLRAMCDYTGLSEKEIGTLHEKQGQIVKIRELLEKIRTEDPATAEKLEAALKAVIERMA